MTAPVQTCRVRDRSVRRRSYGKGGVPIGDTLCRTFQYDVGTIPLETSSKKGAPEGAFLLGQHAFLEDDLSGELHAARVAGEDSLLVIEAGAVDGDEAAVPG